MLRQRVITAIVLVAILLAFLFAPFAASLAFFALVITLAGWEWGGLVPFASAGRVLYALVIAALLGGCWWLLLDGDRIDIHAARDILGGACVVWAILLLWVITYPGSAAIWGTRPALVVVGIVVLVPACVGGFPLNWYVLAPALRRLARDAVRWRPDLLIGALTVAAGFATVALQGLFRPAIALLGWRFDWLIFETLRYLPFFALGVALQITPALFARFHHVSLPVLALAAVLAFAAGGLAAEISRAAQAGLELFVREALTLPVVAGLLWAFRRFFSAPSRPVEVLTGSIYTVYLFHYLALYAFALLLAPVLKSDAALYFACVALAFSATFALHRLVVSRVPFLRLLFNGRPISARVPDA